MSDTPTTEQGTARVLLDATGLGTLDAFADEYVIELARAAGKANDNLVVVCRPRDAKLFKSFNLEVHRAPDRIRSERSRRFWLTWSLPRFAKQLGVHVIHSPHDAFPAGGSIRRVVAVHHPVGRPVRPAYRTATALRLDVVAPSETVATDLRDATTAPANRVHVAHRGIDKNQARIPNWDVLSTVSEGYGFTEWITVVASDESVDALAAFCAGYRQATEFSDFRPSIVVTGIDEGIALRHIGDLIDAGFDVRVVGSIVGEERSALLGGALFSVVLDDSSRTGRSLLEAMMCGATVLTTTAPTFVECGGSAVAFAEPSAAAMEIAITELIKQPERRQSLATSAVTHANLFTWDACLDAHRAAWSRARARA